MVKEAQIMAKIVEEFETEIQGMTGNEHEFIVMLKDKEIVIKNYFEKTPEQIIEEIKKGREDK